MKKHSNADRLQIGECFGNQVIVDLSYKEGDIGVYFPVDGKLGVEFASANNLVRKKDENGNNIGGYLDPEKRNIRAIRLRGEKSDGLFLPLNCLSDFTDVAKLQVGDTIDVLNGVVICEKYIPISKKSANGSNQTVQKKKAVKVKYPFFEEHKNTEQLAYNMDQFKEGQLCTITLKMHGTSNRISNTIIRVTKKKGLLRKLFKRPAKTKTSWGYISGTRRTLLDFDNNSDVKNGYYDNNFRRKWHDLIAPKLHKGEEIFFEIVGYVDENTTIMPVCDNKKLNDKEFVKKYGNSTVFSYGCEPGQNDAYVYRMIKTDEDGNSVEYPDWLVRYRAEQMGLKCVPLLDRFIFTTKEDLLERVNRYVGGTDPIGKTHIREGVVVRIYDNESFKAYKSKNFEFKVLEGIIKENASEPDMEEAEDNV